MNFRNDKTLALFIIFFLTIFKISAQFSPTEMGTIIVTYQTDQDGVRLDRIRFWLINANKEKTLYPKKDEFVVNNHSCLERTVVITHLPVGDYTIEFLIPNADHMFDEISPRTLTLGPGTVVKIDQAIRFRPPTIDIAPEENHSNEAAETPTLDPSGVPFLPVIVINRPSPVSTPLPTGPLIKNGRFSLNSNLIVQWQLMREDKVIYSSSGDISQLFIPPGRHYYLVAQEMPGYTLHQLPPNPFDIEPGESIKIDLIYQHDTGFLELQGAPPVPNQSLSLRIEHEQHQQPILEVKLKPIGDKISWQSGPLAIGEYRISYDSPEKDVKLEGQNFFIEKGRRTIVTIPNKIEEKSKNEVHQSN